MIVQQAANGLRIEQAPVRNTLPAAYILDNLTELVFDPLADRHVEAVFRLFHDLVRQKIRKSLFQNPLCGLAP